MTIWKFGLPIDDRVVIPMPAGASVLCVQTQNDAPCLWAVVDPGEKLENRVFLVRGTGHDLGEAEWRHYIGTFQIIGGALVFHVFDGGKQ